MENTVFEKNIAGLGAAVALRRGSTLLVKSSTFANNLAQN